VRCALEALFEVALIFFDDFAKAIQPVLQQVNLGLHLDYSELESLLMRRALSKDTRRLLQTCFDPSSRWFRFPPAMLEVLRVLLNSSAPRKPRNPRAERWSTISFQRR
jgi:hypothetical protein